MSTEPPEGRVEIIALAGLPEVREGDDLEAMIGDALEATADALPFRDGDVLVVTQKVVSKAEGAVADLREVTPRPEAVAWAEAWGRDARQIEVVLREARRIVRMQNGVLITETEHGFVCANGGVDASNVGPDSGDVVTLLPRDPDASADRIRAALTRPLRHRHRRHRVRQLRPPVALGHRGRRARRVRACSRSTTCAASPTPTAA